MAANHGSFCLDLAGRGSSAHFPDRCEISNAGQANGHSHSHEGHGHDHSHSHDDEESESINLRGAVLHIIGCAPENPCANAMHGQLSSQNCTLMWPTAQNQYFPLELDHLVLAVTLLCVFSMSPCACLPMACGVRHS